MSYSFSTSPLLQPFLCLDHFLADDDITAMLRFEIALTEAQERSAAVPKGTTVHLRRAVAAIDKRPKSFAKAITRDGLLVPELVRRLREKVPLAFQPHLHNGTTSQDVIDTSLMLRAALVFAEIAVGLSAVQKQLGQIKIKSGRAKLMARTRMQSALSITVADRIANWSAIVGAAEKSIKTLKFPLQLSGPVGTTTFREKKQIAKTLGLDVMPYSWQVERSPIIALGNACGCITAALGKLGMDVALMAQNERTEIKMRGGGSSSAMPHKQNPVKAEILVSLAHFNAALLGGLHQASVHEQERSGLAWTLEWLILPQIICAAAGSARVARELLDSVESVGA